MKTALRANLERFGLLGPSRALVYWLTRLDRGTTHPRRRMVRFYSQFISKGDLCFDVGANIGDRSSIFLELGARVVSIEPQSSCMASMHERFERDRRVTIVGKGVSDREGWAELSLCEDAPPLATLSQEWKDGSRFSKVYGYQWNRAERIQLTTLDRLIADHGVPSFCKIDVEGYERVVLAGLSQPIPCLSFEFNREMTDEAERCVDRLLELAPYEFNFSIAEPMEPLSGEWTAADRLFDALSRMTDQLLWGDIYARLKG